MKSTKWIQNVKIKKCYFKFKIADGKVNTNSNNYSLSTKTFSYNTNYNVTSIYKEK